MSVRVLRLAVLPLVLGVSSTAKADDQLDYGQYLAGECTTCHRRDGKDTGIPSIIGMDKETFLVVMKAYQTGDLTNQAMVSVAKSLDGDQLKALAVYFSSLKPPPEKPEPKAAKAASGKAAPAEAAPAKAAAKPMAKEAPKKKP